MHSGRNRYWPRENRAILALLPFNYLNAQLEEARNDIQDAATHLELHLTHRGASHALQDEELAET
jgi:hypothetical protein